MKGKAIVTVIGKDDVGILAKVATCCANANANIVEVAQNVMAGMFTMVMMIELSETTSPTTEIEASIKNILPTMEVHVMHENIFDSMHSI